MSHPASPHSLTLSSFINLFFVQLGIHSLIQSPAHLSILLLTAIVSLLAHLLDHIIYTLLSLASNISHIFVISPFASVRLFVLVVRHQLGTKEEACLTHRANIVGCLQIGQVKRRAHLCKDKKTCCFYKQRVMRGKIICRRVETLSNVAFHSQHSYSYVNTGLQAKRPKRNSTALAQRTKRFNPTGSGSFENMGGSIILTLV